MINASPLESMHLAIAGLPPRACAAIAQPIPHSEIRRTLERCHTSDEFRAELPELLPVMYRSRLRWTTKTLLHLYMAGYAACLWREGADIQYCVPLSWGQAPATLLAATERAARGLSATAYAADGIVRLGQLQAVIDDWYRQWPDGRDEIDDDEEQALFDSWKRRRMGSGRWARLPVEEWNRFVIPVLNLAYMQGHYQAMREQARRQPLWRFERGATCRRHDAFDGLVARYNDPIWKTSLPPLAYGCDCTVRALAGEVGSSERAQFPANAPQPCRFFGNDKRESPGSFVSAYIDLIEEECLPDCPPVERTIGEE